MTGSHHVLIGGCGFIGRHVGLLLARAGARVTLADRVPLPHDLPADVADRISWKLLELGSADWDTLVADADVVHHYAWGSIPASANANPGGDLFSNVGATVAMLDALQRRGSGRVVFSSSGGTVYGRLHQTPVLEDHPVAPITAYGAGKATAEIYLGLYRAIHGLDCRIARISNPYGAGQDLSRGLGAATTFLHRAMTGQRIVIWGTGEVIRDYIHISDTASALVVLATAPRTEHFVFNIASGKGISLNGIVRELETLFGPLDVSRTENRAFDVPVSVLAIDRARAVLNWSPKLSFSEGMAQTLKDLQREAAFSTL